MSIANNGRSTRLHADDVRESFRLGYESVKQVTTLTAGSFLLSATFLDTIFRSAGSAAHLAPDVKILIGGAFLCFVLSLVFATFSMWRIAALVRSRREYYRKKFKIRWNIVMPSFFYIMGLSLFGTAVLANVLGIGNSRSQRLATVKLGANNEKPVIPNEKNLPELQIPDSIQILVTPRFVLYTLLGVFIVGVISWFGLRLIRGYRRDKAVEYKIVYPSAADLDEIIEKEKELRSNSHTAEPMHVVVRLAQEWGEEQGDITLRSVELKKDE
jgi:hypothetical protein